MVTGLRRECEYFFNLNIRLNNTYERYFERKTTFETCVLTFSFIVITMVVELNSLQNLGKLGASSIILFI